MLAALILLTGPPYRLEQGGFVLNPNEESV